MDSFCLCDTNHDKIKTGLVSCSTPAPLLVDLSFQLVKSLSVTLSAAADGSYRFCIIKSFL